MSPYFATVLLIVFASLLLGLPLAPAIVELYRKSDAEPLVVVQQNAGDVRFFADGFRNYLNAIQPTLNECLSSGCNATVTMPDGDTCTVLGLRSSFESEDRICSEVIVSGIDLELPSGTVFSKDIYAGGAFRGGKNNQYRAILGERDVHLSAGGTVMRWVHAVGEFSADCDCKLYGRISSQSRLRLDAGCGFLRLNAPRIETGSAKDIGASGAGMADDAFPSTTDRQLRDGDFEILAGDIFRGNLVVRGNLRIGAGAQIHGSVKCGRQLLVEDCVSVAGSLISAKDMQVGRDCLIRGPVIAERSLYLSQGTRCGSGDHPTTVSAPDIKTEEGVIVFGTVWAREHGQVVKRA
jgi:cytoskeletal protein CcmA (bactofilin family)